MNVDWLSLVEYSRKYKLSISTLRRRIKNNKMEFRLDDGKYFLEDKAPRKKGSIAPLAQDAAREAQSNELFVENTLSEDLLPRNQQIESFQGFMGNQGIEQLSENMNQMLSELKKAYAFVLQEREEQIIQLKNEIIDLKTLVRVLEDENLKLQQKKQ